LVWIVRTDLVEAVVYGGILASLLLWRVYFARKSAQKRPVPAFKN